MKDTLFLQFYSPYKAAYKHCWALNNGFSDTYDLCKSKGDFYWIKSRVGDELPELPIKKGNVFVSTNINNHIYQSYLWSKKYPDISFVVGGSPIISNTFKYTNSEPFPKNLKFTKQSVEQYFNTPDFSYNWKLEVPEKKIVDNSDIFFTYTIQNQCYWNKCIFCTYSIPERRRPDSKLNFEFQNMNKNRIKRIYLGSPSMPAKLMSNIIPKLPRRNDLRYRLFIRASKNENKALEKILKNGANGFGPDPQHILFQVGVEFPGNRMLQYMKKGTTVNNILDTINIINKYNGRMCIFLILGWPNLIKEDVHDVEEFVKKIPKINEKTFLVMKIWRLFARIETPLYDQVEKEQDSKLGPFTIGAQIKLSREKLLLNNEVRDIFLTLPNMIDYYTNDCTGKKRKYFREETK